MSTSVLIADDQVVLRRGLRALFDSEPDISGLELLEQLRDRQVTTLAASPDAYESLTAREREVLLLLAQGMTNPASGLALASAAGWRRRTGPTCCANWV